jgi:hypothetical protein
MENSQLAARLPASEWAAMPENEREKGRNSAPIKQLDKRNLHGTISTFSLQSTALRDIALTPWP